MFVLWPGLKQTMAAQKQHLGELFERYGVRYFVALTAIFYAIGTIIFNIYLRKLGSFEFDLLQLRYMFVGLAFVIITSVFPLLVWAGYGIAYLIRGPEPEPSKRLTPGQKGKLTREKHEKNARIFYRWKIVFLIFIPVWLAFYSWSIFPEIPSGFGGARPYAARLIGTEEAVQKINDQIAFEAGVESEKLPFEVLPGASGLTTGANVLILDKSSSRIFLLLTRDLYLSSTSSFAKKMLELGKIPEKVDTETTESFRVKPLIVSAEGIDGITLSLYEPPEVTTKEDLQLAAEILAANPEKAQAVSDAISKDLPGVGEKIVAAVQQHEKPQEPSTDPTQPVEPKKTLEETINNVIKESVDTTFLDFRALSFNQAALLMEVERKSGMNSDRRRLLIQTITETFTTEFPDAWALLDPTKNFLVIGQSDPEFPRKIKEAFRGAEDAFMVMNRLNTTEKTDEHPFTEVQAGAKKLLDNSVQTNTQGNRDFVAQSFINYFNNEAPRRREFWAEGYLSKGTEDESYFQNLATAFTEPTDWESFKALLADFTVKMNETCTDGIMNQDETDIDCGGEICEACVEEIVELEETCNDGIQNQDETGVDCGGTICSVCPEPESCEDGIQNQDETDIDCGGTVCDVCVVTPDPTCTDGIQNQDETDIDCGGTACDACVVTPEPTCTDGIQNQDETDVDCGGNTCDACVVAPEPTCTDGIQNGDETGVDCGGTTCDACAG